MKKMGNKISLKKSWNFNGNVPLFFDKHISLSVPFYEECHNLLLEISDHFVSENSNIYDIGCSTGKFTKKLFKRHNSLKKYNVYGLDLSKEMIKFAKKNNKFKNLIFKNEDINNFKFDKSSLIISYYTIQFLKYGKRSKLIKKIFNSLESGGAFLFFEKIRGSNGKFQDIYNSNYYNFKLAQGFTHSEIYNKSVSIKGNLEPETSLNNIQLLKSAGFKKIEVIFKFNCFEGICAIK